MGSGPTTPIRSVALAAIVAQVRLRHQLEDVIEPAVDSVRFYRIHGSLEKARTSIGRGVPHVWGEPWIL